MRPAVTVLIDTYNHERFIAEAIRSVLDQDFPRSEMEILVVDDGSTDRTPEIVREFEPQVRLLRKSNGGQASAFNFGIERSRGELVALLDGDDVWLPPKISRVVAEFRRQPELALVYHKSWFWDSKDGRTWNSEHFREISGDVPGDRRKLLSYSGAPTSALTFHRRALARITPVPETLVFMADTHLFSTAIFVGRVAAIPECLTRYRVHGENLYFADSREPDPKALQRRLNLREEIIRSLRDWVGANVPRSQLPQARLFLRRMSLVRDDDEFRIKTPGRIRFFLYRVRQNLTYGAQMTRSHLAYRWVHAFAELVIGKQVHYLEGIRTRARKLRDHLKARPANAQQANETAGPVQ